MLICFALLKTTLNIWLENIDHRKARAWGNEKCKRNFIDWLAHNVAEDTLFRKVVIFSLVPFVAIYMLKKYPQQCFLNIKQQFVKYIIAAKENIFK
jgi:hypothetical protein